MQTIRSLCGRIRISFSDTLWGKPFVFERPWAGFLAGTAGPSFYTMEEGIDYYKKKGYKFTSL